MNVTHLEFEKRDIILVTGCFLFMVGLIPFMATYQAVIIAILIYFGIKVYVGRRKKMLAEKIGDGICLECGEKTIDKTCPNCDSKSN